MAGETERERELHEYQNTLQSYIRINNKLITFMLPLYRQNTTV